MTKIIMDINYNPFSLAGKTILVTGASSGIGKATAIECSRLGATVFITGRNEKRLRESYGALEGDGHKYLAADLTVEEDLVNLISNIDKLDGIVLCAGKGTTVPFLFCDRDKFDDIFNINFFSPVELLRLLVKKKRLNPNSSVVFVASIGGTKRFTIGNSIYGTAKAALQAMVNFTAIELAPKKIRVNSVCPGMVNTPLIDPGKITKDQMQVDVENYLLKRYGEPIEIAHSIIFLLSDASSWITGHGIVIDGGRTLK